MSGSCFHATCTVDGTCQHTIIRPTCLQANHTSIISRVSRIVESGLQFFEILEDVQRISSEYVSTPKLVPNFSELRLVRGYLLRISYALSAGGMAGIGRTSRRGAEVGVLLPTATPPATVLIALKPYGTALGTMGGCTGRKCVGYNRRRHRRHIIRNNSASWFFLRLLLGTSFVQCQASGI